RIRTTVPTGGGWTPAGSPCHLAFVFDFYFKDNTMKEACQTSREWIARAAAGAASVLVLAFWGQPALASDPQAVESYRKEIKPILEKYCFDCHAEGGKKGNVSFDTFKSDDELVGKRELWHAVLKNTRANIMPPAKKERPTAAEQQVL